jgi:hypothetical protein
MRRAVVVGAVVAAAAVALAIVALARRHGHGDPAVASVGGTTITRRQLDLMIEHFHEEADREGRPFPDQGTSAYRVVERQSLALLVDRARLEVAARRLGIAVTAADVDRRAAAAGGGTEEGGTIRAEAEASFARSTARAQLLTEAVFRRVTAAVRVPPAAIRAYYRSHRRLFGATPYSTAETSIRAQLVAARKNAAMTRWLERTRAIKAEIRESKLRG